MFWVREALAGQKFKLAAWLMQKSRPCAAMSFLHWLQLGSAAQAPVVLCISRCALHSC